MARRSTTQHELAEAVGLGQPQLSKRLKGRIPFKITELAAIAAYLEVPLSVLVEEVAA